MIPLNEALKKTAVIGAAGKMGSGISLLLLQEMARLEAESTGSVGCGQYCLVLVDSRDDALNNLRKYLRTQITKYAERTINSLRSYYARNPRLVSNEEIIRAFVDGAMDMLRCGNSIEEAKNSLLVFEAIIEDIDAKTSLLQTLAKNPEAYFFTNTSSIPIGVLNQKGGAPNRLIGYHFYNPPAVQKLLEIIPPENGDPALKSMALELSKRLHKIVVVSKDAAGFIGNGHFLREISYACTKVKELALDHSLPEAIYLVNRVTQEFLLRPMGIFQLIDYVGIDVCQKVASIMTTYLPEVHLETELVDRMVQLNVLGGQFSDGSQKNGFFRYEHNAIDAVFDADGKKYLPLNGDNSLGELPRKGLSWRGLQNDPAKKAKLEEYFQALFQQSTHGAELAKGFLWNSRNIARGLVQEGIAANMDDVNTVLENGFFHLYGADAAWIPLEETVR